ncbi:MAG: phosphodiesterase [Gammaproteobacteria bacterium]
MTDRMTETTRPFLLAQVSDLHIKAGGKRSYRIVDTAGMLRACIAHMLTQPQRPDVVVFTGDLVDFGRPDEYAVLRDLIAPLTMPVYLLPGNHDERGALREAFPGHAYLSQPGGTPDGAIVYAIDAHPVRIVALDTTVPGKPGGLVDAPRLAWLDARLAEAPGKPTVVLMHHPPFHTFIGHMDRQGLEGSADLARVIEKHPQVERLLCGHLHRPIQARFAGTIACTVPGPAHQVALDLAEDAASRFVMDPPAYGLHAYTPAAGMISHTAFVGQFAGPYPFYEGGKLID